MQNLRHESSAAGEYDIYPGFPLGPGRILTEYRAIAQELMPVIESGRPVLIDGYGGVLWDELRAGLDAALREEGLSVQWLDVSRCLLPEDEVLATIKPFLGGDDPLFGTRYPGRLSDFFDAKGLQTLALEVQASEARVIVYGVGAAVLAVNGVKDAYLAYVDVPKDEIQRRMRTGQITNLGASAPGVPKTMYKRFYFVDWPALNRHKETLVSQVDLVVDAQIPEALAALRGNDLRHGLQRMATNYFRVRPWFYPGPWGGQWMKQRFRQLPQDVPNYAWSFELIAPENGLTLESDGNLLEVSFDWLMYHGHASVLGRAAARFGSDFPIRFDYLDTMDGGNLSVQVHPRPGYIAGHFGETFTQDETYYIVDCKPGARVYLGFQDGVDADAFRQEVEYSAASGTTIDVDGFVQSLPSRKGDLLLIPHGTIHGSGANNLVLEISATPYIFTFKIYDWVRRDLEGNLRPLNIERAWENLYFERQGGWVRDNLIAKPRTIESGDGWRVVHLPTHPDHFYNVHRLEFATTVRVSTEDRCHVLNLVDGESVVLETAGGLAQRFSFGETFVVPAAAGSYRLVNEGDTPCQVIKAFVR
jgi:mannose-6-phosphate isomerase class I